MTIREALHSSETNEWYTPIEYIQRVRRVFNGVINLDPASCKAANEVIKADVIFTEAEDGLSRQWNGTIFLNPPYGKTGKRSNCDIWIEKLLEEYEQKHVSQAILLVNAVTDRSWFKPLWNYDICFVYQRIKFWRPGEVNNQPTNGNVFVYFGNDPLGFSRNFEEIGEVVRGRGWR